MAGRGSPARVVLEYLETHADLSAKEARGLLGFGTDSGARAVLQELAQKGIIERVRRVRRGPMRFGLGRHFSRWREWEANGFQTDVLTRGQFSLPGLLKPLTPGLK